MVKLESSWLNVLAEEFEKPYFKALKDFLIHEKLEGKVIYPPGGLIFNALNSCHFDKVKVVILGQDPYHGHGEAHGLSFSVPDGVRQPPSLQNIFKEIKANYPDFVVPRSGNLQSWVNQGVLLLNAVLTVEANKPGSHAQKGWEQFTDTIIQSLSFQKKGLVFMLWGNYARQKKMLIQGNQHCILEAAHPSPFSFFKGFSGCRHFVLCNEYLISTQKDPIIW
jgi:uracil-DNA glycosylase